MSFPSLTERKRAKAAAMSAAVEELARALAEYASRHGGRYVMFGSAARGEMRHDSDVDILVDFPTDRERDAQDFAESEAHRRGLRPDTQIRSWSGPRLLARIAAEGRVLP